MNSDYIRKLVLNETIRRDDMQFWCGLYIHSFIIVHKQLKVHHLVLDVHWRLL